MYILEFNNLKKGDIILTAEKKIISKSIRTFTKSNFSHAILYVGDHSYIHSDRDGVHSGNIQRLLFAKESYATILRCKSFSSESIEKICQYARSQIGTKYSIKEAIKTKSPLKKKVQTNRQFCSRLVAQAYDYANLLLVKNIHYCSPQELMESNLTFEVTDCVRKATKEEIIFSNTPNILDKQILITNDILQKTSAITKQDIQTLEEILKILISNPQYDIAITNIIQKSGYLSLYQEELRINKWRYDKNTFLALSSEPDSLLSLASAELNSFQTNKQRYHSMHSHYTILYAQYRLNYIKTHINLYSNLLQMCELQQKTCEAVIFDLKSHLIA